MSEQERFKSMSGQVQMDKISRIDIQLPNSPSFDTYSLKNASQEEIRQVEQGKKA